jgi:hypothetical protein
MGAGEDAATIRRASTGGRVIKGFAVALVQVAMILSIGAKLAIDRASLPHLWVQTAPYDPNLPIRGRYVSLLVMAEAQGFTGDAVYGSARLRVEGNKLIAQLADDGNVAVTVSGNRARLTQPVAFFIPEHVPDPSWRQPGEELWVEVTIPKKGPPRPIQLGVKKNGVLTPLDLR